jgi:hypothetical protein
VRVALVGARGPSFGWPLLLSYPTFQRFKIVWQQFHDAFLVAGTTPAIAVDAADQHLTVVVDPH